jgi:3-oxoacyl-[acyl-carrier protein] reductase
MGRLRGKVVLVTGAGSGFGEAIAHSFVKEGANVLIGDFVVDSGKRVESDIASKSYPGGGTGMFVEHNVVKKADWERALELAKSKFGKLDIVVNNAGTTYKKQPSMGVTEEDFDRVLNVNCKSIYWSVAVIMPYFVEQKSGVYVNTSSVAGARTRPGQVFYGGTKGFLNTVNPAEAYESPVRLIAKAFLGDTGSSG